MKGVLGGAMAGEIAVVVEAAAAGLRRGEEDGARLWVGVSGMQRRRSTAAVVERITRCAARLLRP